MTPDLASSVTGAAPKVLIVDDDPGVLLLMRGTLSSSGFIVEEANSGLEAVEKCANFVPDLVLLDINMPVMDGISACENIREKDDRKFPIVMVTSVDDALSIQSAFEAGATDFILKPINWPLLQHRLASVMAEWQKSLELNDSNRRVNLLEKVTPEWAMIVARGGAIVEDLRPHPENDVLGITQQSLDDIFDAEVVARMKQRISGVLKTRKNSSLEFEVPEFSGHRSYEAKFLLEGRERVILIVQDVSLGKDTDSEVYELAYFDPVTGLPNRNLFKQCAKKMLTDAGLQDGSLAIICLQFDNLGVEDLEHVALMRAVTNRLDGALKNHDRIVRYDESQNARSVARIATNLFTLILANGPSKADVIAVCDAIMSAFDQAVMLDRGSVQTTPTLGIAMCPRDGQTLANVLHAADAAMQEALKTDKSMCFYSQSMNLHIVDTRDHGAELTQALQNEQIELYFQPRNRRDASTPVCLEALLRWNHPLRGYVPLDEMLQLAKATGLIISLGDWVLQSACRQAVEWPGPDAPRVSVNLSQQEFAQRDLADRVIRALDDSGLEPERLELEVTEAALMRTSTVVEDLERLTTLGIGLVLDDFGTGYTSLTYLMQCPISALKIDGSFVRRLAESPQDAAMCEVIITIAHKLGMKAIAEEVETEEQFRRLAALDCDEFQGFFFCKPLPPAEIVDYLQHPPGHG